jgi:hypothetical protein
MAESTSPCTHPLRCWNRRIGSGGSRQAVQTARALLLVSLAAVFTLPLNARDKVKVDYGMGLTVNIPAPESEVEPVVADIAQDGIIRGTKEYNKDEYVAGAAVAASCEVFPAWKEGGKIFFKVRKEAIDPRGFKDSDDVGTLAVRYVLKPQGDKNTVLRIDAIFVEDFRHMTHLSNGSVEVAEYKDIKEHLDAIEEMKAQTVEAEKERQAQREKKEQVDAELQAQHADAPARPASSSEPSEPMRVDVDSSAASSNQPPPPPAQTLEERLRDLRRQVERTVKAPGAPLKSAPFHTASTLQTLASGTEVLIVVSTPYWFGVETHDGQHGWISRDQLELLP